MDVPAYVTPADIAKALGMSTKRSRAKMHRAGLLEPDGEHRYQVNSDKLAAKFPAIYRRLFDHFDTHAPNGLRRT